MLLLLLQIVGGVDLVTNATEMKDVLTGGSQLAQCGLEVIALNGLQCVPPVTKLDDIETQSAFIVSGTLTTGTAAASLVCVGYPRLALSGMCDSSGRRQFTFLVEVSGNSFKDGAFHLIGTQIIRAQALVKLCEARKGIGTRSATSFHHTVLILYCPTSLLQAKPERLHLHLHKTVVMGVDEDLVVSPMPVLPASQPKVDVDTSPVAVNQVSGPGPGDTTHPAELGHTL